MYSSLEFLQYSMRDFIRFLYALAGTMKILLSKKIYKFKNRTLTAFNIMYFFSIQCSYVQWITGNISKARTAFIICYRILNVGQCLLAHVTAVRKPVCVVIQLVVSFLVDVDTVAVRWFGRHFSHLWTM